jgi:hypothetical protein
MVLRAMVLGWLDGLFTSIHERVLYPSHRLGGEGNDYLAERKPPPPLFYSVAFDVVFTHRRVGECSRHQTID